MTKLTRRLLPAPDQSTSSTEQAKSYLPGMGHDWLLPLYDPFTRALGVPAVHRRLADQADVRAGQRVLEIGCGTGNLLLLVKRLHPETIVVGLDPDSKALARAGRKASRKGLTVQLDHGYAGELPYPDASFDRVLSAFMFHHLDPADRRSALQEVRRVLAPGGSLHLVDFGGAHERPHGLLARLAHRSSRLRENLGDRVPALMSEAGLLDPVETGHDAKAIGRYAFYRALR